MAGWPNVPVAGFCPKRLLVPNAFEDPAAGCPNIPPVDDCALLDVVPKVLLPVPKADGVEANAPKPVAGFEPNALLLVPKDPTQVKLA